MKCLLSLTLAFALVVLAVQVKNIVTNDCDGTAGVYIDCSNGS